jgi:hypothetical protein
MLRCRKEGSQNVLLPGWQRTAYTNNNATEHYIKSLKSLLILLLIIKYSERCVIVIKKTTSLQAWTDPEVSRRLRLPDFKTFGI